MDDNSFSINEGAVAAISEAFFAEIQALKAGLEQFTQETARFRSTAQGRAKDAYDSVEKNWSVGLDNLVLVGQRGVRALTEALENYQRLDRSLAQQLPVQ